MTILLDDYASKWPGKVEGEEELAKFAMKEAADFKKSLSPKKLKEEEDFDEDEDCHQSNDFGKAMRKASLVNMKSASQSNIIKDATMYTYCNGKSFTHSNDGDNKNYSVICHVHHLVILRPFSFYPMLMSFLFFFISSFTSLLFELATILSSHAPS